MIANLTLQLKAPGQPTIVKIQLTQLQNEINNQSCYLFKNLQKPCEQLFQGFAEIQWCKIHVSLHQALNNLPKFAESALNTNFGMKLVRKAKYI